MSSESIKEAIMLSAQKAQTPQPIPLPKRFYKDVSVIDGVLALDGRKAKTPAKNFLKPPANALPALIKEWEAQVEVINPKTMPVTRLINSLIDGVASNFEAIKSDILSFAGTDLICYRAVSPQDLLDLQVATWQPILDIFRDKHNAPFISVTGIQFVEQPERSIDALEALLPQDPFKLGAIQSLTTLTGSALLAFALYLKHLTPEQAWRAAHIDEDYQIAEWGEDDEALERRAFRHEEYLAACLIIA